MKRIEFIKSITMAAAATSTMSVSSWAKEMADLPVNEVKMPVLFIGHGNPMNAILDNEFTRALKKIPATIPTPKAIVCISAHWLTKGTFVNGSVHPKMIYDMYGFPDELYKVNYPAPGFPALAKELQQTVKKVNMEWDTDWGFDHGCWMVLKLMYPEATIPVFQMSIDIYKPAMYHYELAKELAILRQKGVLIVGSGNIVHNLRMVDFQNENSKFDWALEFDSQVKNWIDKREDEKIMSYEKAGRAAALSIPTPDHYFPLAYTLGLTKRDEKISYPYEGIQNGSVSMRCVKIG